MKPLQECLLYAFVDTTCLRGRAPAVVAQQLCDGGADLIQLRAKQSSLGEIRRMAEAILPVTRRAGIGLVINDHPSLAQEVGAEFCHLGQDDFFGCEFGFSGRSYEPNIGQDAQLRLYAWIARGSKRYIRHVCIMPAPPFIACALGQAEALYY